jgi:hypothetical protein
LGVTVLEMMAGGSLAGRVVAGEAGPALGEVLAGYRGAGRQRLAAVVGRCFGEPVERARAV